MQLNKVFVVSDSRKSATRGDGVTEFTLSQFYQCLAGTPEDRKHDYMVFTERKEAMAQAEKHVALNELDEEVEKLDAASVRFLVEKLRKHGDRFGEWF